MDIKVPAGLHVSNEMVSIFGGADLKDVADPIPGAPTLVLKGLTLFGGVSVREASRARGANNHRIDSTRP